MAARAARRTRRLAGGWLLRGGEGAGREAVEHAKK